MCFVWQFLLGPVFFSDRPPVVWWLSPGKGWDAATYDAFGVNCKKTATSETHGSGVKYLC